MDLRTLSNLGRFKDIVATLFKFGFDDLVERLDLPGKELVKKVHKVDTGLNTYERIRLALEDLGPTFVKFGQIMSQRPDLLPGELLKELRKLQDEVTPVSFEEVRTTLEESLERPLEEVFAMFDQASVAAASLSQVHRAVLRDGGHIVAAKVQRAGIRKKIRTDLEFLESIAQRLHERFEALEIYELPSLIRVTKETLFRELDFRKEAHFMEIARGYLQEGSGIHIPQPYSAYCTEHVLIMEYVEGTRLKDLDPGSLRGSATLARRGLRAAIKQILEDGFFHADPHPGNLLITEDGALCYLDWGMVGRLTEDERDELIQLIYTVVNKESKPLVEALVAIAKPERRIDRRRLERNLLDVLDVYHTLPLKDINVGQLLLDITALLREHRLRVPPDFAVMIKALVTAEGTARQLYPDLNVIAEAEPQVRALARERFSPSSILKKLREAGGHLLELEAQLPRRFLHIVEKVEHGELRIHFAHENLTPLTGTFENIFNRLTLGIIIASLIVGSSLIITTGVRPFLFGFPALGVVGYLISAFLALWLVWNIIRGRRY